MGATMRLAELELDVVQKDVKNVHLSVYPPDGHVRVTAPRRMSLETLRAFVITKLGWIRGERRKFQAQAREEAPLLIDRESHYVWGDRYLLEVAEVDEPPEVALGHSTLTLRVRPGADRDKRDEILALWYRDQVRDAVGAALPRWEAAIGVQVRRVFVQRMKTRWGSCNPKQGTIRLNTELAKKPPTCLEYVLVHELVHLVEATHNERFVALMDRHLPKWREVREELNRRPLAHEDWLY